MSTGVKSTTSIKFRTQNPEEVWISEGIYVREILNHPDHPAFSLARCRLPAGKTTQLHQLSLDETYIIETGSGLMRVGSKSFNVTSGNAITIPPHTVQNIKNTGTVDLVFLVHCSPRFTQECYTAVKE